jgi:hypothetical protein
MVIHWHPAELPVYMCGHWALPEGDYLFHDDIVILETGRHSNKAVNLGVDARLEIRTEKLFITD